MAGAPKFGDVAAWKPRVCQPAEDVYSHAVNGFQGDTGVMPPKGGFMNLSDEEVMGGVDYMVESVGGFEEVEPEPETPEPPPSEPGLP